jgi:hypothetical protein
MGSALFRSDLKKDFSLMVFSNHWWVNFNASICIFVVIMILPDLINLGLFLQEHFSGICRFIIFGTKRVSFLHNELLEWIS